MHSRFIIPVTYIKRLKWIQNSTCTNRFHLRNCKTWFQHPSCIENFLQVEKKNTLDKYLGNKKGNFQRSICFFDDLCSQPLEPLRWDLSNCDKGVELLLCVFLFIPLASNAHTNTPWNTPDAPAPYVLVKLHINSHICCPHCLLCKFPYLFNSFRSHLLESAVQ